jgi:hypothetical protein
MQLRYRKCGKNEGRVRLFCAFEACIAKKMEGNKEHGDEQRSRCFSFTKASNESTLLMCSPVRCIQWRIKGFEYTRISSTCLGIKTLVTRENDAT